MPKTLTVKVNHNAIFTGEASDFISENLKKVSKLGLIKKEEQNILEDSTVNVYSLKLSLHICSYKCSKLHI